MGTQLTLGEWLDDWLKARGLTQVEFAESAGVGPSTVSAWINGAATPTRRNRAAIARALGVTIEDVLARTPPAAGQPQQRDIDDPLLSFAAANHHLLTPEQKRLLVEMARALLKAEGQSEH